MTLRSPHQRQRPRQPRRYLTILLPTTTLLDLESARRRTKTTRHGFMVDAIQRQITEILTSSKRHKDVDREEVKEEKRAA